MIPLIRWTDKQPTIEKNLKGWLTHDEHWPGILAPFKDPRVLEIGSFYGKQAHHLLSNYPDVTMVCIDPWKPYGELKTYDMDIVFATWEANLWEFRNRVLRMRTDSITGMLSFIHNQAQLPNVVYIDGAHDSLHCYADVSVACACFPKAKICGDDFNMPGVRQAVTTYAKETNKKIKHDTGHSSFWEYL